MGYAHHLGTELGGGGGTALILVSKSEAVQWTLHLTLNGD